MYYTAMRNQVRQVWENARKLQELQHIPDEVLDLMKDSALAELDKMEMVESINHHVDSGTTPLCLYPTVDKYPYEKDRK